MAEGTVPIASQRLFFALVPDLDTVGRIESVQRKLNIPARAVKAGQFHVTLAFLGNQPIDRLPLLLAIAAGLDMPACTVAFDRLGSFQRARVAWLGVSRPPVELLTFQARLAARLEQERIALDHKPWKFHLTLYRDLRTPLVTMEPDTVSWDLNGFSLVESVSTGRGVEYRQLGRWKAGSPSIDLGTV